MTVDRNKLEQLAMRQLQKGQLDRALDSYIQLLRADPRNRRVRKTIAELHLRLGQNKEAERRFLEVVESLRKEGNNRAAIPIYQQLIPLRPKDHEVIDELGDCYLAAGFPNDARKCYERAVEMTARLKPDKAQEIQRKLVRLAPGEVPLRVRHAELLEAAKWSERAFSAWVALGEESRRLGRPDDQARFLERALTLRDDWETRVGAAEARIKMGEPRQGLAHLQKAFAEKQTVAVIALLAEGLQAVQQLPKARQLWLQASRLYKEAGEVSAQVRALQAALECSGGEDAVIARELSAAGEALAQSKLRLDTLEWARPRTEREIEVVIRARVQADYGFPERALETLKGADDLRDALSVRIALAELLASQGDREGALEALTGLRAPTPESRQQLYIRRQLLAGEEIADAPEDELLDDDLLDDDDDLLDDDDDLLDDDDDLLDDDDDLLDDDDPTGEVVRPLAMLREADGDRLASSGDIAGAVDAYREAMNADPNNERVLVKLGEMMSRLDQEPDTSSVFRTGGTFAEVSPDDEVFDDTLFDDTLSSSPAGIIDDVDDFDDDFDDGFDDGFGDEPEDPALAEARARISVGMYREAASFLKGRQDLQAMTLVAKIRVAIGDLRGARNALRGALSAAVPGETGYTEALWTLSEVYIQAKKPRAALRMIEEIESTDSDYRPQEVADRRRGLALMSG